MVLQAQTLCSGRQQSSCHRWQGLRVVETAQRVDKSREPSPAHAHETSVLEAADGCLVDATQQFELPLREMRGKAAASHASPDQPHSPGRGTSELVWIVVPSHAPSVPWATHPRIGCTSTEGSVGHVPVGRPSGKHCSSAMPVGCISAFEVVVSAPAPGAVGPLMQPIGIKKRDLVRAEGAPVARAGDS